MLYTDPKTTTATYDELETYRVPTIDELRTAIKSDTAGSRWKPIHHRDLIDNIRTALTTRGFNIVGEQFQINKRDGHDLYGCIKLEQEIVVPGIDYAIQKEVGFKTSNMQRMRLLGLVAAHVTICANGIATGEFCFGMKHTSLQDYEVGVDEGIGEWAEKSDNISARVARMVEIDLSDPKDAEHVMITGARDGAFAWSQLGKIDARWRNPTHVEFEGRNAWNLYQAVNETAKDWTVANQERGLLGYTKLIDTLYPFCTN